MLRVRIDGGQLDHRSSCARSPTSPPSSPATPPTSPTGRTSSCTGSASRTCPAIWRAARGGRPVHHRGLRRLPRASILGCPVAGIAADEIIDGTPADRRDRRAATSATRSSPTCRASSRPRSPARRATTSRTRSTTSRSSASCTPSTGPGFDLWVGGGLSTNPMLAQRLGAWVPLDEVPDVWAGVVGDLPRLRLPPAAQPGPAEVPGRRLGRRRSSARCWRTSTSAGRCSTARRPSRRPARATTSACTRRSDGRFYVGVAPIVGRVVGHDAGRARRPRRGARLATGSG